MSKDVWYPLEPSSYTSWDGNTYAVPCTIYGAAVNANLSYDCPDGYLPPRDESDPRQCIQVIAALLFAFYVDAPPPRVYPFSSFCPCNFSQACPVNAYTRKEYNVMWIVAGAVSTIGFILNVYMAATWYVLFSSTSIDSKFWAKLC